MAVITKSRSEDGLWENVKTILWVGFVVILIRTFLFEPFNIPSGSMIPTLLVGDYVFVSKFSYGYSKYSFPLWNPPFDGRIMGSLPKRGDVAVFRLPREPSTVYIKRMIGLPGDKIQVTGGQLYINGAAVPRVQADDFMDDEYGTPVPIRQFVETLPNGVKHPILQQGDDGQLDNTQVYEIPPGHVFGMGDNRSNSQDSRALSAVGYIPVENLIGPAEFRFFSIDLSQHGWWEFWWWPFEIRYLRFFTPVR